MSSMNKFLKTFILASLCLSLFSQVYAREFKKKELKVSLENALPPFNDYPYFDGLDLESLKDFGGSYNKMNAWILSEISTLSYSPPNIVKHHLKKFGFHTIRFFNKFSTQAYVAHNDHKMVIVFRGTEASKFDKNFNVQVFTDWATDLNAFMVKNTHGQGKIHQGFLNALNNVWDELKIYLEMAKAHNKKIWITGHSLGGALATLTTDRLDSLNYNIESLYTYGSPRVANPEFKNSFRVPYYRFVNHNDIVTRVPFNPLKASEDEYYKKEDLYNFKIPLKDVLELNSYTHLGNLIYFNQSGNELNYMEDEKGNDGSLILDSVLDHTPTLYSLRIWNSFDEIIKN